MLWKISQHSFFNLLFGYTRQMSKWYRVFKKSQCATGSDSDQPVMIRLAKSESSLLLLFGQVVLLVSPDKAHSYNEKIVGMQADPSF